MKKVLGRFVYLYQALSCLVAFASSSKDGPGIPWEHALDTIAKSIEKVAYVLLIIAIMWAGVEFFVTKDKQRGFNVFISTIIGGAIVVGGSEIVQSLLGAVFK